jgi:hypothetical protein
VAARACEIRLRAERKAGQLLAKMPKDGGGRPSKNRSTDTTGSVVKLKDLGISKDKSSQWQKLGAIPQAEFEEAIGAAVIRTLGKHVVADVVEIGQRLTECKRIASDGN